MATYDQLGNEVPSFAASDFWQSLHANAQSANRRRRPQRMGPNGLEELDPATLTWVPVQRPAAPAFAAAPAQPGPVAAPFSAPAAAQSLAFPTAAAPVVAPVGFLPKARIPEETSPTPDPMGTQPPPSPVPVATRPVPVATTPAVPAPRPAEFGGGPQTITLREDDAYTQWYNSLPASTRAFVHAPGSPGRTRADNQAADFANTYGNDGFSPPGSSAAASTPPFNPGERVGANAATTPIPFNTSATANPGAFSTNNAKPLMKGLGFADGGPIQGPGGPREDNLLIAASNGEFVMPADVVAYKGKEFFDKLIEKSREANGDSPTATAGAPVGFADGGYVRGYADGGFVDDEEPLPMSVSPGLAPLPAEPAYSDPGLITEPPGTDPAGFAPVPAPRTPTSGAGLADFKAARNDDDREYLRSLPTAQKVGLLLESFGAAVNGQANPIDRLIANKGKREAEFRQELSSTVQTIAKGMEVVKTIPPGKARDGMIEMIVRSAGGSQEVRNALLSVGTEHEGEVRESVGALLSPAVSNMVVKLSGGDPAKARELLKDKDFMQTMREKSDQEVMPSVISKVRIVARAMGKMPAFKGDGVTAKFGLADLIEQNEKLPKEFKLTDIELSAVKSNQELLSIYGLQSEKAQEEQRKREEKKTDKEEFARLVAGLRPKSESDNEGAVVEIADPDDPTKSIKVYSKSNRKIGDAPRRTPAGKPLPSPLQKQITESAELVDATSRFSSTFNDDYAGFKIGAVGNMVNKAGLVFGDETGRSQWWQDYELHQSQIRNKLFGAALTAPEIEAWNKSAINPGMDAKEVRKNLARRKEIEDVGLNRVMRGAAAGGYNKEQIEEFAGRAVPGERAPPPGSKKDAAKPASDAIPTVKTDADYAKLAPGAEYLDPNGVRRRKK